MGLVIARRITFEFTGAARLYRAASVWTAGLGYSCGNLPSLKVAHHLFRLSLSITRNAFVLFVRFVTGKGTKGIEEN